MLDERIQELQQLAAQEGFTLPWPAKVIVALEEQGHVVDLATGHVIQQGGHQRVNLTVIGEAMAIVWEAEA